MPVIPFFRRLALCAGSLVAAGQAPCAYAQSKLPGYIQAAISSPARPQTDSVRDMARKPGDLIALAGVKPGDRVGDLMPGQGYFTRLFSLAVGSTGHVYALVPSELAAVAPKIPDAMKTLSADPAYKNVTLLVAPTAQTRAPEKLDLVWTSQNYHDVYGFFGPKAAASMDAAIYQLLKPGGVFMVIDHVAVPGSSATSPATLHRIDPDTVKQQVIAAGFKLEAVSDVLRNPNDTHRAKVFDPAIRGRTDQFIFKFRKPGPA